MSDKPVITLQAVEAFVRAFIQAEYEAYVAMLSEPDEALFYQKVRAVRQFGAIADLGSSMARFEESPLPNATELDYELKHNYVPRKLLKLERYTQPDSQAIFVAYVSSHDSLAGTGIADNTIDKRYIIEQVNGRLLIARQQGTMLGIAGEWHSGLGKSIEPSGDPDEVIIFEDEE